ncbi:uncharacterized protein LOC114841108 [Diachasma alloeum]|uniref:Gustatory receptor n=1 Tax=Diachasma alloeum TaxID=454923 RepID=A0A4E0S0Y4_9HYME|nr:uncharacterized protein LOC114841108 [Diachasma alloeum]THK32950.1 gustatory receptor 36 [Diachasma alloeum]
MSVSLLNSEADVFILKLNLIILKLLGLAPVSFNITKSTLNESGRSVTCKISLPGIIYNICLIIFSCILVYISLPELYNTEYINKTPLTQTIDVTLALIGNIVAVMVIVIFSCQCKLVVSIFNKLFHIETNFSKLLNTSKNRRKKYPSILFFWTNIFYCIYVALVHIGALHNDFISLFALTFPTTVCGCLITQYSLVATLVEDKFKRLNQALLKLLTIVQTSACSERTILSRLFAIKKQRFSLCELTAKISQFFGLPLLFTITYFSGALIYATHLVVRQFIILLEPNRPLTLNTLAFILLITMPIISLCILVTRINIEMDKTADIVRKLMMQFRDYEIIKSELQDFFLELLHPSVQFTAYNVFSLDCSLLYSIFSAVATYLVILAQVPDEPCTGSHEGHYGCSGGSNVTL